MCTVYVTVYSPLHPSPPLPVYEHCFWEPSKGYSFLLFACAKNLRTRGGRAPAIISHFTLVSANRTFPPHITQEKRENEGDQQRDGWSVSVKINTDNPFEKFHPSDSQPRRNMCQRFSGMSQELTQKENKEKRKLKTLKSF